MKKKEMFDWIRNHFGDLNETMMEKLLNMAMDDFCEKTEILNDMITIKGTSESGKRYYTIDDRVLKIKELRLNEVPIPRLMDTGIIDSTIIKKLSDDGTGTEEGTEEDLPVHPGDDDASGQDPGEISEDCAYFANTGYIGNPATAGYEDNQTIQYIEIPSSMMSEASGTRNMTVSVWVKFTFISSSNLLFKIILVIILKRRLEELINVNLLWQRYHLIMKTVIGMHGGIILLVIIKLS